MMTQRQWYLPDTWWGLCKKKHHYLDDRQILTCDTRRTPFCIFCRPLPSPSPRRPGCTSSSCSQTAQSCWWCSRWCWCSRLCWWWCWWWCSYTSSLSSDVFEILVQFWHGLDYDFRYDDVDDDDADEYGADEYGVDINALKVMIPMKLMMMLMMLMKLMMMLIRLAKCRWQSSHKQLLRPFSCTYQIPLT